MPLKRKRSCYRHWYKTKVNDLDVGKLKTVPADLKKISDVVDNETVKNTKFNTLKSKVKNLKIKFLMELL